MPQTPQAYHPQNNALQSKETALSRPILSNASNPPQNQMGPEYHAGRGTRLHPALLPNASVGIKKASIDLPQGQPPSSIHQADNLGQRSSGSYNTQPNTNFLNQTEEAGRDPPRSQGINISLNIHQNFYINNNSASSASRHPRQ